MSTAKNTIFVGVDGSDAATGAVRYAARSAERRGAPLRIVTTYSIPAALFAEGAVPPQAVFDELKSDAEPVAKAAVEAAKDAAPGLTDVSYEVLEGNPAQALIECSRVALFVVLGSRGIGGIKGMVLGSVSAAVASHAFCPVVVTREDTDDLPATGPVVVGVDGSEISAEATDWAFAEASARGVPLVAVHTWMDSSVLATSAGVVRTEEDWKALEQDQEVELAQSLAGYADRFPNVEVVKVITRDRPVRALVEQAEDAQLVVVGSHGRGGFAGMVLGSTSRALLQASPCPVMVVRPVAGDAR